MSGLHGRKDCLQREGLLGLGHGFENRFFSWNLLFCFVVQWFFFRGDLRLFQPLLHGHGREGGGEKRNFYRRHATRVDRDVRNDKKTGREEQEVNTQRDAEECAETPVACLVRRTFYHGDHALLLRPQKQKPRPSKERPGAVAPSSSPSSIEDRL